MHLVPVLPMLEGETVVSWCGRLARFHAGTSSHNWLYAIELSRHDVIMNTPSCLTRLSKMTGIPVDRIEQGAISSEAPRLFRHKAEIFGDHFTERTWTTYCPACLLEDAKPDSPSLGLRVGRVNWLMLPVRTCPRHGLALVRTRNTLYSQQFQDMAYRAPDDATLVREVDEAVQTAVSPLQLYIENRFAGGTGPTWLDEQGIDQAARACEMLGACLEYGGDCSLETLSMTQWDTAGATGFAVASRGPEGIYQALDEIRLSSAKRTANCGPQAALGRIFKWLQFGQTQKERGPIVQVVRDYILETIAIAPGTKLFGEEISGRRRHSVQSLANQSGIHPKTVRRALVRSGLLEGEEDTATDPWESVEAAAAEKLIDRIKNSLLLAEIPDYINCNRTQAEQLVRNGILNRLVPEIKFRGGVLNRVAIEDLDRLISRMRSKGKDVAEPSPGMANVISASEIARETVVDIVRLVLDGALHEIELLPEDVKFRSVLVNPQEVRAVMDGRNRDLGLTEADVAKRLGITLGVSQLRLNTDRNGSPFLTAKELRNSRGTVRHLFEIGEVERFEREYVKVQDFAKESGRSTRATRRDLKASGIKPIFPANVLRPEFYRRCDL